MNESEIKQIVKHLERCRRICEQCNDLREENGMSIRPRLTSDEVMALSRDGQNELRSAEAARQTERKKVEEDLLVHLIPLYEVVHALWDETETANDTAKGRLDYLASEALVMINHCEIALGDVEFDTLGGAGKPKKSSERSHCHPRFSYEKDAAIREMEEVILCPEEAFADVPYKDYQDHANQDLAWVVNASYRTSVQLTHWIEEAMIENVLHYYAYNENPCHRKVLAITKNMDSLITHWQCRNPDLSKTVSRLYDPLQKAAEETDRHYKRLSILPYWNEKDYNPKVVKAHALELRDKLLHIASLAWGDLEESEWESESTATTHDAYIPFTKAIEFSNGILTRKKLEKAIDTGQPIRVRDRKPGPQRREVHIQDVIQLMDKLSSAENAKEEAARMFRELVKIDQSKQPNPDLD